MATLVPEILLAYLSLFRPHFTKPSFTFFCSYVLSLLLSGGRKTMSRVAHTCFWVDRHLASWERFLSQNRWDTTALFGTLLDTLHAKLADSLKIHGAYLAVVDTLLIAKNGHKMPGVQLWKDHSGNADRKRGRKWKPAGLLTALPAQSVSVHLYGKVVTVRAVCRVVWC